MSTWNSETAEGVSTISAESTGYQNYVGETPEMPVLRYDKMLALFAILRQ